MKILLCIPISICIISFILNMKLLYTRKKNAKLICEIVKVSYENLMLSRKYYHEAKFIENSEERERIQLECRRTNETALRILSDFSENNYYQKYLTEKQKKYVEEVLSRPRYKVI